MFCNIIIFMKYHNARNKMGQFTKPAKAKKKPLDILEPGALGVTPVERLKPVKFEPPPVRSKGVMVKDTQELIDALRRKGLA